MSFYLVQTNATTRLASSRPAWGIGWDTRQAKRLYKLPAWRQPVPPLPIDSFQQTHWSELQHVLVHALARHPARTLDRSAAAVCVVAAPDNGGCEDWNRLCPGQPLAVIDTPDVDDIMHSRLCPTLWRHCDDKTPSVLRVVGAPGVFARPRMARCRTLSVPWLSHARTAAAASQRRQRRCEAGRCFETVHIAIAAVSFASNKINLVARVLVMSAVLFSRVAGCEWPRGCSQAGISALAMGATRGVHAVAQCEPVHAHVPVPWRRPRARRGRAL